MTLQRRSFTNLPSIIQTNRNNLELAVTDDLVYEPEQAEFVSGFVGDTSKLTAEDLARTPRLVENSALRQKYQFSIGVAHLDPITQNYVSGAFYDDLLNHLTLNGAFTNDPNRLFSSIYYAWSPPIDYDKLVNPSRYVWTGTGSAAEDADYITKEAAGSQTRIHYFNGTSLVANVVTIVTALPGSGNVGDIVEDVSTTDRYLYRWDGVGWGRLNFRVADTDAVQSNYNTGDYIYVCRTGPNFNRPIIWVYRPSVGHWVSIPIVVNIEQPDQPAVGMIWEDTTISPARTFRIYDGTQWKLLDSGMTDVFDGTVISYTKGAGPTGTPTSVTYRLDTRAISAVDSWSALNWWRCVTDISASDKVALGDQIHATRPIIEFWGNLEAGVGDTRTTRNQFPKFKLYAVSTSTFEIVPITTANFPGLDTTALTTAGKFVSGNAVSTIFNYVLGSVADPVLDLSIQHGSDGEPLFHLDLERMPITVSGAALKGYRFYKDTATGLVHSVWEKARSLLQQQADSDGLYEIPHNLKSNPDHLLTTEITRSSSSTHFGSVMQSQTKFSGTPYGANNYRFTPKDLTLGARMIDPQETLFREMAVLQTNTLDIPDAIRAMAREYNSVMAKFFNQLNILWNSGTITDPTDTLRITASEAVDVILTVIFSGRNSEFPFYNSVMGTYLETRVINGEVYVFNSTPQPIYIPNSGAQIGTSPPFVPGIFTDTDGVKKIRGHDGSVITAFSDNRDLVVLALENRFYAAIPAYLKDETSTYSSRFNTARFHLADYYGKYVPNLTAGTVSQVVNDYNTIVGPTVNQRVYSHNIQVFAIWDGTKWLTRNAITGDVFFNDADDKYYIFNGFFAREITTYNNNSATFDYSTNEFRSVISRDFERWVVNQSFDYLSNNEYNAADPFTWNYSSSGVEGNYRGIYRRVYHTVRPHSHPWEVVGYSVRPSWWLTSYVPTSTATDGTPRYANTHPMWQDFQNGIVNPLTGKVVEAYRMLAPIPVDATGALLDPITSGLVNESALTPASLGDDWQFGDGALVEEAFYSSYYYQFTISLAGYLMKPGIFVDRTWSEFYRTIGDTGSNLLWNAPHLVYSNTLNRPKASAVASQLSLDEDGDTVVNPGFNAWVAEYANLIGKSANEDLNNALLNCAGALGWKASGFLNQQRTRIELLSGDEVPFEDISIVLHQGPSVKEYFHSGIIIVRDLDGFRVFGTDVLNPYFRVELGAKPIQGGQIETLENFTYDGSNRTFVTTQVRVPSSTSDTAKFSVLINGYRMQDKFVQRINSTTFALDPALFLTSGDTITATVITTISNPGTQLGSFTINGTTVTYFQTGTGTYVDYPYGTLFQTLSDVVNMMVGYGRWLSKDGWIFERLTNGQLRDWLGAGKAFVKWATDLSLKHRGNAEAMQGEIFEYSVMGRQVQFDAPFGMILGLETTRYGAYGIVDSNNKPIRDDDVEVVSSGLSLTVSSADTEIFGLRLYLSEIQHVVFLPNRTIFGDIIYDPALGMAQDAVFVDTYRTTNWNGRMEAPGFLIRGGQLLPNWEKQTNDITRYYDRFNPVDDPTLLGMARNLFGYVPKEYMDMLAVDDRTKFNFFHGSLKRKGTFQPYRAFIRGTTLGSENVNISEDWAWKFARHGDTRQVDILFNVNEKDFVDVFQVIYFDPLQFVYTFTGDNSTTCFEIPQQFVPQDIVVLVDDVLQLFNIDYTVIAGSPYEVCFVFPPDHGAKIIVSLNDPYVHANFDIFYTTSTSPIETGMGVRANNLFVSFAGDLQESSNYTVDGTTVACSSLPALTSAYIFAIGDVGEDIFLKTNYQADGLTKKFATIVADQTLHSVIVAIDGIWQNPILDYTLSVESGRSFINFVVAPGLGSVVLVMAAKNPNHIRSESYSAIGNGTQTQFNTTNPITSYRQVIVSIDGVIQVGQIPPQDVLFSYSIANGGVLFAVAPQTGARVNIFVIYDIIAGEWSPAIIDERVIRIPQFSPPNSDPRWVIPPPTSIYAGLPFTFPVLDNEAVDLNTYIYSVALVDQSGSSPATHLFHWDPAHGLHEPYALSKIDYKTPYDPARYNQGPLSEGVDGLVWGELQVGRVWWDISTAIYSDYESFVPDYTRAAREWGKLKYFTAIITRVDELVTVTTLDPKSLEVTPHGLTTGQPVIISGADQTAYNGRIEVTVASATTFTFVVNEAATTPGTGDIVVQIGLINCYEWVASPVPPIAWPDYVDSQGLRFDAYTGQVLNTENPSYVSRDIWDEHGNVTTIYYFWVENNTRTIAGKDISVYDIAGRLLSPFQYEIPYFSILDQSAMFVFIGTEVVLDGYAVEVSYEWLDTPKHVEWLLIGEGSNFSVVPELVTDKLIDSILGEDIKGNPVPNITLAPVERFGTLYFPAQSVFQNTADALTIYIDEVNLSLTNIDLQNFPDLKSILVENELTGTNITGYWSRAVFWAPGIDVSIIYDTVEILDELTHRTNLGYYSSGDIVKVLKSDQVSIWEDTTYSFDDSTIAAAGTGYAPGDTITLIGGAYTIGVVLTVATVGGSGQVLTYTVTNSGEYTIVPPNPILTLSSGSGLGFKLNANWEQSPVIEAYYQYNGSTWNIVGIEDHTVEINNNITTSPAKFREFFYTLRDQLPVLDINKIIFSLLFEMLRQNPICDWFFKTSYIDLYITQPLSSAPYVRPDHASAVLDAILDLKPFRTKLRDFGIIYNQGDEVDNLPTIIQEDMVDRITLVFDRLASDLSDENAWDTIPWDATAIYPEDSEINLTFIGDGTTKCFTLPRSVPIDNLVVTVDGDLMMPPRDYSIDSVANTLCFVEAPGNLVEVEVIIDGPYEYFNKFSFEFTGDGLTDSYTLPTEVAETTASNVVTSVAGVHQTPVSDFVVQIAGNTDVVYLTPPTNGTIASGLVFGNIAGNVYTVTTAISDGSTLQYSTNIGNIGYRSVIVIVDGVWQSPIADFFINNTNPNDGKIILDSFLPSGTKIVIYAANKSEISGRREVYTGDGVKSEFTISNFSNIIPPEVLVHLNGIQQRELVDYVLTSTGVSFFVAPPNQSILDIMVIFGGITESLFPINTPSTIPWDMAYWDYLDLGRQEYDFAGIFIGDGITESFTIPVPLSSTLLYDVLVKFVLNGQPVTAQTLGITVSTTKLSTGLVVFLSDPLPANAYGTVYVSRGFYDGLEPSFGYQDPSGVIFTPTSATYEHYFARLITPSFNPAIVMSGSPTPEERIQTNLDDMWTVVVKTEPLEFQPPPVGTLVGLIGTPLVAQAGTFTLSYPIQNPTVSGVSTTTQFSPLVPTISVDGVPGLTTAEFGSLAVEFDSGALVGLSALSEFGTLAMGITGIENLEGTEVVAASGSFVGGFDFAASGQSVTANYGNLSPSIVTVLAGVAAAAQYGTFIMSLDNEVQAFSEIGTFSVQVLPSIPAAVAMAEVGSVTVHITPILEDLIGVQAQSAVGTIVVDTSF